MTGIEAVSGTVSPKGGEVVHMARDGEVGIILIDNPPGNALGAAGRAGQNRGRRPLLGWSLL